MNYKRLIIVILIIFDIILLGLLIKKNKELNVLRLSFENSNDNLQYLKQREDLLESCLKIETNSNHIKINPSHQLISISHDTTNIQEIIDLCKSNILIFYFSNNDCHSCITEVYNYMENLNKKNVDVVVFAHFKHFHNFYNHFKSQNSEIPTYWVTQSFVKKNEDYHYNFPFFFITDSSFLVKRFFIPKSEFPERTKQYFSSITP